MWTKWRAISFRRRNELYIVYTIKEFIALSVLSEVSVLLAGIFFVNFLFYFIYWSRYSTASLLKATWTRHYAVQPRSPLPELSGLSSKYPPGIVQCCLTLGYVPSLWHQVYSDWIMMYKISAPSLQPGTTLQDQFSSRAPWNFYIDGVGVNFQRLGIQLDESC